MKKFKLISFKTKKDIITSIIIFAAIAVVIFSAVNIAMIFINYKEGTDAYDSLADLVGEEDVEVDDEGNEWASFDLDFEALQEEYPDAIGYIWQEDTVISYPIMQTTDNSYYLTHLYDGTENSSGSIFVDFNCSDGLESINPIVYGHNMKNDSMFGTLQGYKSESYFEEHPVFNIYIGDTQYIYYVFSAYVTDDTSDTYTISFADESSYQDYLDMIIDNSLYDTDVDVTTSDNIITLSTCTGQVHGDQRLVVHLVRGEELTDSDDSDDSDSDSSDDSSSTTDTTDTDTE